MIAFELLDQLLFFIRFQLNHDILRFKIGVYDFASLMEVDQPKQDVSSYLFDEPQRHALFFVLVVLDYVEQVGAHQFKYTTHVLSMNPIMREVVEE